MKKALLLVIICISCTINSFSQFYKKHENNKLKFYGTFDFRNSIILEENLSYYGVKLGFGNKSLKFGLGYHILHKNLFSILNPTSYFSPIESDNKFFSYRHLSVYIDPIVYQNKRLELLVPIHLNIGRLQAFLYDSIGDRREVLSKDFVPSFTVSFKANYKIFKWAGLTAGFGDNFVFLDDSELGKDFNTVFYSFGIKLFFNEIIKMSKDKAYRKKYLFNIDFDD